MAKPPKKAQAPRQQAAGQDAADKRVQPKQPVAGQAEVKQPPTRPTSFSSGEDAPAGATGAGGRISWWALLAMVFLVPIATTNFTFLGFQSPITWDMFEMVKAALERTLALVALGAWAWTILRRGGLIRRTPVDWLILAFLAWVTLTTATSTHWPTSLIGAPGRFEGLVSFVNYAIIYFLVLQLADHGARVRRLAQALFWASIIVSVYAVIQFAGLDFLEWGERGFESNRAFATYGNPNLLGGFLIFSLTIALCLALLEQRLARRLLYWVGFGLNGFALIVAFTRGAWIGGVVSLVLLGVIAWRQRAKLRVIDWVPAAGSLALALVVILRSLSSPSEVMNFGKRLGSIFQFGSGSGQTRTEIWQAAIAAIKERPALGWGSDTFQFVFPRFKPLEYVRDAGALRTADNAHNYPLHLASGTGIPGALMFYGIFVWAGVRSFGSVFRCSNEPTRIILGAFWAASAGYLLHLFFGISVIGSSFLLWIALALLLVPTARLVEVRARKWGTLYAAVIMAVAGLGIAFQGVQLAADNAYLQAKTATSPLDRTAGARRAAELNRLNAEYRTAVGAAYIDEMRAYQKAGAEAQESGRDPSQYAEAFKRAFADGESALKDAIAFAPDSSENYGLLVYLYNGGGAILDKRFYGSAIATARQGLAVDPYNVAIRTDLAQALISTGDAEGAVEQLQYCVSIDPGGAEAALALADIYRQTGKAADALALLKSVEDIAPGQPGVAEAIQALEAGGAQGP